MRSTAHRSTAARATAASRSVSAADGVAARRSAASTLKASGRKNQPAIGMKSASRSIFSRTSGARIRVSVSCIVVRRHGRHVGALGALDGRRQRLRPGLGELLHGGRVAVEARRA